VGAVEDEVAVLVGGHNYGVSLLAFRFHALAEPNQPVFVVGLVQDQALKVHQSQVSEGGDHAAIRRFSKRMGCSEGGIRLQVSGFRKKDLMPVA
jgi:hypothetical protein